MTSPLFFRSHEPILLPLCPLLWLVLEGKPTRRDRGAKVISLTSGGNHAWWERTLGKNKMVHTSPRGVRKALSSEGWDSILSFASMGDLYCSVRLGIEVVGPTLGRSTSTYNTLSIHAAEQFAVAVPYSRRNSCLDFYQLH